MRRTAGTIAMLVLVGAVAAYGAVPQVREGERPAMCRSGGGEGGPEGGPQGGRGFGPPPEAYAACEGKTAGAAAQFTNPEGEVVAGKCQTADGRLVLRPDRPKGQGGDDRQGPQGQGRDDGRHGPPPEAYAACEGKKTGAVSQFTDPRGEVLKGVCVEEDGKMVLRPDRNRSNRPGPMSAGTGTARSR